MGLLLHITVTSFIFLFADCGINAHKHCKDLVVMECRSKASVACNRRMDSLSSNGKKYYTYLSSTLVEK